MTEYNRTYYSAGYTVDMQWICHDVQHGTFQSWQKVPCVEPDIKGIPLDGVCPLKTPLIHALPFDQDFSDDMVRTVAVGSLDN